MDASVASAVAAGGTNPVINESNQAATIGSASGATNWNAKIGTGQEWINIQVPSCGDIRRKAA